MSGQVAMDTGAGNGIGRAPAIAIAQEGCRVALAGRRWQPLRERADESWSAGVQHLALHPDVTDSMLSTPQAVRNDDVS